MIWKGPPAVTYGILPVGARLVLTIFCLGLMVEFGPYICVEKLLEFNGLQLFVIGIRVGLPLGEPAGGDSI